MKYLFLSLMALLSCVAVMADDTTPDGPAAEVISLTLRSNVYKPSSRAAVVVRFRNLGTPCRKITVRLDCEGNISEFSYETAFDTGTTKELNTGFNTPDHATPTAVVTAAVVAIDNVPYEGKPCSATFEVKAVHPRTVVIEEGTGTWCGWCVRGIVAMDEMKKKYPDSFIGIAVHVSDKMAVDNYAANLGFDFAPGCNVDRLSTMRAIDKVSSSYFESYYYTERQRGATADFTFDACIDGSQIVGRSQATFDFDRTNADMRMVYVILEDGVTGYYQLNNYSGGEYGQMGGYEEKPKYVVDQVFNDVARAIYPCYEGEECSLADNVVKGQEYVHEFAYDVPEKVADIDSLSIVAMMLDGVTGEIINAHKLKLDKVDVIASLPGAGDSDSWYTVHGVALASRPTFPGLYIHNGRKIKINNN